MNRKTKALKELEDSVEIIYDVFEASDFVEVKGEIGGDLVCYRVYFDSNDNVDGVYAK